ncbi:extracellular solute-binding protein [Candidatus Gracilibacteria bacterium]|nr:extracellular solute-binding protein [Candidatus Gracilibacteria bacterium]
MLNGKSTVAPTTARSSGDFKIWIVGDSKNKFEEFLSTFRLENKSISDVNIIVESFPNYEEYSRALTSAMIKGIAPDIFVLNNNETSIFEEKITDIPTDIISPIDFKKNYRGIFTDDLILESVQGDDPESRVEFLKGFPVGYETLGIFHNRRFRFKPSDFNSLASLNSAITRTKKLNVTPLGIGNGSTVVDAQDILSQFFLLHKVDSLENADATKIKQALGVYAGYGAKNGENAYNELFTNTKATGKTNIDLFTENDLAAIVAYPRAVLKLQALGFSSKMLFSAPFPHFHSADGGTLANYNYFVVNSDSEQKDIAFTFLKYLNSDAGSSAYLDKYRYYLPARLNLEAEMIEQKVSNYFDSVVLGDFYTNDKTPLSSFNKGNKIIFDREVISVLDNFSGYLNDFSEFKTSTLCKTEKILNLKDLGVSCN